jgi:hypothetical protein
MNMTAKKKPGWQWTWASAKKLKPHVPDDLKKDVQAKDGPFSQSVE